MAKHYYLLPLISLFFLTGAVAQVSQIDINRIALMPNEPTPFNVRNWAEVAMKYDSFIYDLDKTGQYLPTVSILSSGVNYPEAPTFGLHSYIGTTSPNGREAINILPSLVGASLVGIDKTDQFGRNWVKMSQDFFNKSNGQFIYNNNAGGRSGSDWWYDLMPNIYFYQLNDLYPNLGSEADFQFLSIANQFTAAVRAMGGKDTPWEKAYMNYRAWDFLDMKPNADGAKEPEAAGAYAWILYHAWKQTQNKTYLKAAEWSMEFLNDWTSNPSYELQLPYGIYVAAKMNAELNTDYDIEKMINWSFDRGAIRDWGAVVGKWGGFDVHGLIGEANDNGNDYAFQMNGLHQAAVLAPMVRYDKRFARAIGKWILNLSNANRLFYPGFLPSFLQDASDWSSQNDPDRVVGYEALREQWEGQSPFSTGDALGGQWAATNLALYGTSSIGYLGAIVAKTNDPKILKIDLLKTDFYKEAAYPTYLLFNPYSTSKTVELAVGDDLVDLYDALSESFILESASGIVAIIIPANEAVVLTLAPAGGAVSYHQNKMLINGVVVDFMQTTEPFKYTPRIQSLAAAKMPLEAGDSTVIFAKAFDKDSDQLTYTWQATSGSISGADTVVNWTAPATIGTYQIILMVTDESGNSDIDTLLLDVVAEINDAPQIVDILKESAYMSPGATQQLTAVALDDNGDLITYDWSATGGFFAGEGALVNWTAPASEDAYDITVTVRDPAGLSSTATTSVLVKDFEPSSGHLIAWYPFSGNGADISGNELHGQISGALFTDDYFGQAQSALRTDGFNDKMTVANDPKLNFQEAITVSCWFSPLALADRESFLLSHGSWQNRWKISITPEQNIRWTVNTLNAIRDLDSDTKIEQDSFYQVTATYDGEWMTFFVNGELQSYRRATGLMRTTTLPFLLGQMLPDNTNFNFRGITDEVKIFDYALHPEAALALYVGTVSSTSKTKNQFSQVVISPNPASQTLNIQVPQSEAGKGIISIFDLQGRLVKKQQLDLSNAAVLNIEHLQSGMYLLVFKNKKTRATARFVKE
ncbi:MAG: LamG-like jellyroll fold domain-containing protein [Saprospiraceae bacterium]